MVLQHVAFDKPLISTSCVDNQITLLIESLGDQSVEIGYQSELFHIT